MIQVHDRLTRQENLLLAEVEQRGPVPASLVLAIQWAFAPYPGSEYPAPISSLAERVTTLEQPVSNKLAHTVLVLQLVLNYKNSTI